MAVMADISAQDLIPLVEQRSVIWDKDSEFFKDKALKAAAWREICCILNPEFDKLEEDEKKDFTKTVCTKWIHIRDAFLRSQKTVNRKVFRGGIVKKSRPYVYKNLLNFLIKSEETRTRQNSFNEILISTSNSSSNSEAAPEKPYQPPPTREMKMDDIVTLVDNQPQFYQAQVNPFNIDENVTLEEKLNRFLDSKLNYNQENPHISFMKGILPAISTFNADESLEFQAGILALIQKIRSKRRSHGEYSQDIKVFET